MARKSFMVMAGEYMGLAFVLPACTFVGYAIGYLLDKWLDTSFLKVVFLLIGIAAGLIELLRKFRKDSEDVNSGGE